MKWFAWPFGSVRDYPEAWDYMLAREKIHFEVDGHRFSVERDGPRDWFTLRYGDTPLEYCCKPKKVMRVCREFAAYQNRAKEWQEAQK